MVLRLTATRAESRRRRLSDLEASAAAGGGCGCGTAAAAPAGGRRAGMFNGRLLPGFCFMLCGVNSFNIGVRGYASHGLDRLVIPR